MPRAAFEGETEKQIPSKALIYRPVSEGGPSLSPAAGALAALLTGKMDVRAMSIGVVLSGGNVDPPLLADILCRYPG